MEPTGFGAPEARPGHEEHIAEGNAICRKQLVSDR